MKQKTLLSDDEIKSPPADDDTKEPPTDDQVKKPPADDVIKQPPADDVVKQPPSDDEIKKYVTQILEVADLEQTTLRTILKQVACHYAVFDLTHKKDFIKATVNTWIDVVIIKPLTDDEIKKTPTDDDNETPTDSDIKGTLAVDEIKTPLHADYKIKELPTKDEIKKPPTNDEIKLPPSDDVINDTPIDSQICKNFNENEPKEISANVVIKKHPTDNKIKNLATGDKIIWTHSDGGNKKPPTNDEIKLYIKIAINMVLKRMFSYYSDCDLTLKINFIRTRFISCIKNEIGVNKMPPDVDEITTTNDEINEAATDDDKSETPTDNEINEMPADDEIKKTASLNQTALR